MLTVFLVGGGFLAFMAFGGAPMLKKVGYALMAQVNRGANFARGADPIANRQYKIDQAAEKLNNINPKLEDLAGKQKDLSDAIAQLQADEKRLTFAAKSAKESGDMDGARELASDIVKTRNKIAAKQEVLDTITAEYNDAVSKTRAGKAQVLEAKDRLRDQRDSLELANLKAEISETKSTLTVSVDLDSDEDDKAIQSQINRVNAKSLVAADLSDPVPARQRYAALEHDAAADELLNSL